MKDYLNIATSLTSNSFTIFVGSGFSKYMTNGLAPSWLELLVECTTIIDDDDLLKNQLFITDSSGTIIEAKYDLTICAQMLEFAYQKKKFGIKETIAQIVNDKINVHTIDTVKLQQLKDFFSRHPNINIITTNYDTLFSNHIIPLTSRIIIEGSTIPQINTGQNIYHIHGCVTKPESIILTINDYYNFQNNNNYFSRKFFTLLQETTVAILGYSLGDFNLNSILNEVKNSKSESFRKTDIHYVTRDTVPTVIKKFYLLTYGINVIQNVEMVDFFINVETNFTQAQSIIDGVADLQNVMNGSRVYIDSFLKLKNSLSKILIQAGRLGIESDNTNFIKVLITVLSKKREFSSEHGAWSQYEHLADWLIDIASLVIVKNTPFETEFCDIAKYSLSRCSKKLYYGYSWYAYSEWKNRWDEMKLENQIMLQELIDKNPWSNFTEVTEIYK
ncbi:SIR2 family protein [Flavobacterium sp. LB3R33]|uniref:SIR2 family protein n=1 Tax=Flavobacterium sp. LB3R33 TaxID=3401721 RepID=UPI003AAF3E22